MEQIWTEGWTERQTEGQTEPSRYNWGSNKTFAYICQEINHYISHSFFE